MPEKIFFENFLLFSSNKLDIKEIIMDLNISASFLVSVYRDLNVLRSSVQRLVCNVNGVIEMTMFLC